MNELIDITADRVIEGDLLDFSEDSNYRPFLVRIDSPQVRDVMYRYPMRGANTGCRQVSAVRYRHGDIVLELDEVDTLTVVDTYAIRRFPADESCRWHDAGVEELAEGDLLVREGQLQPDEEKESRIADIGGNLNEVVLTFSDGQQLVLPPNAVVRRLEESNLTQHKVSDSSL